MPRKSERERQGEATDTPNVSSDGDRGLSGAGEEPGIGWKDGVRHLLRGEGQSGTQPARPGTPTGRTQRGLGTQLWTSGVPASKGVSLSQCRCCFFCLRFHLAMCGRPMCHRRRWLQDDAASKPAQIWQN